MNRDKIIEAVMSVIYPDNERLGRSPIWEWGHEETPTQAELEKLAGEIADAVIKTACAV